MAIITLLKRSRGLSASGITIVTSRFAGAYRSEVEWSEVEEQRSSNKVYSFLLYNGATLWCQWREQRRA